MISDFSGKNISGVIHPWENFPGRWGGQFSSGPNIRGAIMQVTNNPKGSFLWGQLARGTLSGVYYLRGIRPRANYPEGNYPGGNFPRGQLSQHRSIVFPEKLQKIQKKTTLVESVLEKFSRQKAANLQKKIPWWMFSWNFGTFSQKRCSVEHLTRVASENKLDPVEPSLNIIKVSSPNVASNINWI